MKGITVKELFDLENIRTADIVYWNNGLWDLLHFCGNPKPHTEIKLYLEFIEKLYLKINDFLLSDIITEA